MAITIRALNDIDREEWQELFSQYQAFYRAMIPADIVDGTWNKLVEKRSIRGFVAEQNNSLIGIIHLLFHDSTWSDQSSCYVEDLYVARSARGTDAAEQLIRRAEEFAREHHAFRIYWHTQEYNGRARSLYDTLAPPSSFVVYRKSLT